MKGKMDCIISSDTPSTVYNMCVNLQTRCKNLLNLAVYRHKCTSGKDILCLQKLLVIQVPFGFKKALKGTKTAVVPNGTIILVKEEIKQLLLYFIYDITVWKREQ